MNTIGIFGDSFAANPHMEFNLTTEGFLKEIYKVCKRKYEFKETELLRERWGQKYIGWVRRLDAVTYAQSGSDLYFSYNQFVKNHMHHEKCIFVITSPFRYSTSFKGWTHTASYEDAMEKAEWAENPVDKQYLQSLGNFFKNVYYRDTERVEFINNAILDSIKVIRPDTIFINAFPDLKRVYDLELESWKISHDESQDYKKYFDLRQCHMTNTNNKILSEFIKDNLDTSGLLDLSKVGWAIPTKKEKAQYLVKTKNLFDLLLS
jgi:hypothetical protein